MAACTARKAKLRMRARRARVDHLRMPQKAPFGACRRLAGDFRDRTEIEQRTSHTADGLEP
jgi:hypothetical protein